MSTEWNLIAILLLLAVGAFAIWQFLDWDRWDD